MKIKIEPNIQSFIKGNSIDKNLSWVARLDDSTQSFIKGNSDPYQLAKHIIYDTQYSDADVVICHAGEEIPWQAWVEHKQQKHEPALRYDEGKIPYHLFPLDVYEEICKVMQFGAKKYAARNWEKGMSWSRLARSMFSHFFSMCKGETHDAESNCTHAGHLAWNAIALCAYFLRPELHKFNDLSKLYKGQ